MRLNTAAIALVATASSNVGLVSGFTQQPSASSARRAVSVERNDACGRLSVAAAIEEGTSVGAAGMEPIDYGTVQRMSFRELQRQCKERGLPAVGNTAALRSRLLESSGATAAGVAAAETAGDDEELCVPDGIEFCDEADPDFEFNSLLNEVMDKASVGHWKVATRRLKKLKKNYASPERRIPEDAYVKVLEACAADRLHGARASEPARKILEDMVEEGYDIPPTLGNQCVVNCLGTGPNGTHDTFGGIDTALAMLSAIEDSSRGSEIVTVDTYGKVVSALSRDGAVDEAVLLLRAMVVEHSFTPNLSTFDDVGQAASKDGSKAESVLQVLTLAKAAGYELDSIASAEAGRSLLASGLIAAEQMKNVALGLRLLTAAAKADGCAPDRGDDLVCSSSSAAQRAATLIHKTAIDKSVQDNSWKLAVKLLELMPERSLTPSTSVWRKVVTVCAKSEKSKKATAILLDWVKLAEQGKADKPPLSVFNTVVNACEICGEEDLTLVVLETMKKTHETDGNVITMNIALKRLAKQSNTAGCEGIIIGMLQSGMEPNVVSYTTAIGACATDPKDPALAYEWLKRMRSRNVKPNFHTYNTALAACLDGKLESTVLGSRIATEMLTDIQTELKEGLKGSADLNSDLPDTYTKLLARNLMKQLRENWRSGDINMAVAKATLRVPLLRLVDFDKSEAAALVKKQVEEAKKAKADATGEDDEVTDQDESELEYSAVNSLHKEGRRMVEV